ncbi:MAG: signal peptidase I [Lentimonas sp.]|jgi:signal peptidase I
MKKLCKQAKELIQAAHKVYHYRRDLMTEERLKELERTVNELDELSRNSAGSAEPLKASMSRLDALLRKVGGKIYPKTFWNDNVEVALVAAILVIGVRTFFFQPFIIPTNSMYPTYSGMNAVVYPDGQASPSTAENALNKIRLGATHYQATAPQSGEVRVPVFSRGPHAADDALSGQGVARFSIVNGRKWFGLLPTQMREYVFLLEDQPVALRVPLQFNLDDTIRQAFFPESTSLIDVVLQQHSAQRINALSSDPALLTGKQVAAGDPLLEFDITLGDALFVDRLSYHFRRPHAGDPFVFRTRDIRGIEGDSDQYVDKYYIKRIGGVGGETLEIKEGTLFANGTARDEVEPFVRNAERVGEYQGYINQRLLSEGRKLAIPAGKFVALGDNSGNSLDSRYWGFVPERAVIGKAVFIYYPFTKRWGLAE